MAFAPAGPAPDSPGLHYFARCRCVVRQQRWPAPLRLVDPSLRRGASGIRQRRLLVPGNRFAGLVSAFLVVPGALVVGLGRLIEAGEQSIFRQLESVFDDERGVGVVDQIFVRDAVVLDARN